MTTRARLIRTLVRCVAALLGAAGLYVVAAAGLSALAAAAGISP